MWLAKIQAGRQANPPQSSLLYRAQIANMLNRMSGCTTWNMYNVALIPEADLEELALTLAWQKEMLDE